VITYSKAVERCRGCESVSEPAIPVYLTVCALHTHSQWLKGSRPTHSLSTILSSLSPYHSFSRLYSSTHTHSPLLIPLPASFTHSLSHTLIQNPLSHSNMHTHTHTTLPFSHSHSLTHSLLLLHPQYKHLNIRCNFITS
jgi:hypothetical protein